LINGFYKDVAQPDEPATDCADSSPTVAALI